MSKSENGSDKDHLRWEWKAFAELQGIDCWSMLELRQNVFLLEQKCQYVDVDREDLESRHLFGWALGEFGNGKGTERLAAYLRIVPAGGAREYPSLGRIVIHPDFRGLGLGKQLVNFGLKECEERFPGSTVQISAQRHLERFYQGLGFQVASEPYDDAGIEHVKMLLPKNGES